MILLWLLSCATTTQTPIQATPSPATEQSDMSECTVRINPGEPIGPHLQDGAIICLEPGVHAGGLTLEHSLELRGEPGAILDGGGRAPVIQVLAHEKQITLSGITLQGGYGEAGGGLYLDGFSMLRIESCTFDNNKAMQGGGPGIAATGGMLAIHNTRFSKVDGVLLNTLAQVTMNDCELSGDLQVTEGASLKATNTTVGGVLRLHGTTSRTPTVELRNCTITKTENSEALPGTITVLE